MESIRTNERVNLLCKKLTHIACRQIHHLLRKSVKDHLWNWDMDLIEKKEL